MLPPASMLQGCAVVCKTKTGHGQGNWQVQVSPRFGAMVLGEHTGAPKKMEAHTEHACRDERCMFVKLLLYTAVQHASWINAAYM